jgi:hypothetical protein
MMMGKSNSFAKIVSLSSANYRDVMMMMAMTMKKRGVHYNKQAFLARCLLMINVCRHSRISSYVKSIIIHKSICCDMLRERGGGRDCDCARNALERAQEDKEDFRKQ